MTTFDSLAPFYAAGRIGYSGELYSTLFQYGLHNRLHVLDVGCGTGLASQFLLENGFRVTGVDISQPMLAVAKERFPSGNWTEGCAEELPFDDGTFDAAVSGQTFHHLDRSKALAEIVRVLRPGGIIGIWWKHVVDGDPIGQVRNEISRQFGVEPPAPGLNGGFKEFYGAGLFDPQVRVIPWFVTVPLDDYLNYERSRKNVHEVFGNRTDRYLLEVEGTLRDMLGGATYLPVTYVQYLYTARKPIK